MSLVILAASRGAPGVTTSALALAAAWPTHRSVLLVEADPSGSSLGPRFGLPLRPGIDTLVPACRHGFSIEELKRHVQQLPSSAAPIDVVVGPAVHKYGPAWEAFWEQFAQAVASEPDFDVIADFGRLSPESALLTSMDKAQCTLLVARPDLEGVFHLQQWLTLLGQTDNPPDNLMILTIGDMPYPAREVAAVLAQDVRPAFTSYTVLSLAHDQRAAHLLRGEPARGSLALSPLVRSARNIVDRLMDFTERQPV